MDRKTLERIITEETDAWLTRRAKEPRTHGPIGTFAHALAERLEREGFFGAAAQARIAESVFKVIERDKKAGRKTRLKLETDN